MTERRGKPLPESTVASLRRLRLEGHSVRKIAAMTGINQGTVQRYVKGVTDAKPIHLHAAEEPPKVDDQDWLDDHGPDFDEPDEEVLIP